ATRASAGVSSTSGARTRGNIGRPRRGRLDLGQFGQAVDGPARALAADLFVFEVGEQFGPDGPVVGGAAVPLADDVGRGRVEAGDAVQPVDAGVQRQVLGPRVVPGRVRRQAAHRHGPREAAVDQQGTVLL